MIMTPDPEPSIQELLERLSGQMDDITRRLNVLEATVTPDALRPSLQQLLEAPLFAPAPDQTVRRPEPPVEDLVKDTPVVPASPPPAPRPSPSLSPPTTPPAPRPSPSFSQPATPPAPKPSPTFSQPTPSAAVPPPPIYHHSPPAAVSPSGNSQAFDLERLIGGKWFLWVGVGIIFLVVGWIMQYTWASLGPVERIGVGFLTGLAFLGMGSFRRSGQQRWFTEGTTGAGLGILYLTIWAAARSYGLISFEVAFVLMGLTTAVGVALSVTYDALSLIVLSTLGGYLTPAVLDAEGGGAGSPFALLTYIAILNTGIVATCLFKKWRSVVLISFFSTALLVTAWSASSYRDTQFLPVFCYITLYFLQFLSASCFYTLVRRQKTEGADLTLLFSNALIYTAAAMSISDGHLG
ncbi:MAG: DUF2339 domain-containing protein, partial [Armatimonadota bacterium]